MVRPQGSLTSYKKPLDELKKILRKQEEIKVKKTIGARIKRAIDKVLSK